MTAKLTLRLTAALLVTAFALPLVGCGEEESSSSPFEGTYRTIRHTLNMDACDAEGDTQLDDSVFRLEENDGQLSYIACESVDSCDGAVNDTKSFSVQEDGSWIGRIFDASGTRGACDATLTERIATLENGDVRIETRTYSGEFSREDGQDCTDELVLENRGELTCDQYDVVLAVPTE